MPHYSVIKVNAQTTTHVLGRKHFFLNRCSSKPANSFVPEQSGLLYWSNRNRLSRRFMHFVPFCPLIFSAVLRRFQAMLSIHDFPSKPFDLCIDCSSKLRISYCATKFESATPATAPATASAGFSYWCVSQSKRWPLATLNQSLYP